jgi:hypothetical protein
MLFTRGRRRRKKRSSGVTLVAIAVVILVSILVMSTPGMPLMIAGVTLLSALAIGYFSASRNAAKLRHFQLPTDPWYIFNCPQVVHFACPPRGRRPMGRHRTSRFRRLRGRNLRVDVGVDERPGAVRW